MDTDYKHKWIEDFISPNTNLDSAEGNTNLTYKFGDFSLRKFLTRYICGGSALTDCRQVSRTRLALVSAEIDTADVQATLLQNTIKLYEQAREMMLNCQVISIENLCEINRVFTQGLKLGGAVRTSQNWIGESLDDATYVPPPPEQLPELLKEWLHFTNTITTPSESLAILSEMKLLAIHPFCDANGRTARLLYDVLLSRLDPNFVHLSLYRMSIPPTRYRSAIWAFGVKSNEGLAHPYWSEALTWTRQYKQKAGAVLTVAQQSINGKLGFSALNHNDRTLLDYLWGQPVISSITLQLKLGWDPDTSNSSIEKLIRLKILKMFRLKSVNRVSVFVCEDIFEAWHKLDELVFTDKR